MKYKLALVMSAFCAFSVWTEAKVKLPDLHLQKEEYNYHRFYPSV